MTFDNFVTFSEISFPQQEDSVTFSSGLMNLKKPLVQCLTCDNVISAPKRAETGSVLLTNWIHSALHGAQPVNELRELCPNGDCLSV